MRAAATTQASPLTSNLNISCQITAIYLAPTKHFKSKEQHFDGRDIN